MIFASFSKTSIGSNELHFILGTKCYQPFHSYVPFMIFICNKYLLQEEKNFFEQWKIEILFWWTESCIDLKKAYIAACI